MFSRYRRVVYMQNFKLRNNYLVHYLDCSLTLPENMALIDEQLRTEHIALLSEIQDLRNALRRGGIAGETIPAWEQRTDDIYEKLYRYQLGHCSKIALRHPVFLKYNYRRTIRTWFL